MTKTLNVRRMMIRALLLLAGIQDFAATPPAAQSVAGSQPVVTPPVAQPVVTPPAAQSVAGSQPVVTPPAAQPVVPTAAEAELAALKAELHSYKSQAGHWQAEATRYKNTGLTAEQQLAQKEEALKLKDRALKTSEYALTVTEEFSAKKIPEQFKSFIQTIASEAEYDILPELHKNTIKSRVATFAAALDKYKTSIVQELKAVGNPHVASSGSGSVELSAPVKAVIDSVTKQATGAAKVYNPWGTN